MGCGRPGEAAAPLEVLHPPDGRHRVRGGRHRAGARGGGPGGAAQDHPHLREPGGARAGAGQQAGPGLGAVRRRGGEAALRARTEHVHAAPRAGLQRRGRPGAAGGPGEALRDDPEEEEGREAQPQQKEMKRGPNLSSFIRCWDTDRNDLFFFFTGERFLQQNNASKAPSGCQKWMCS